MVIKLYFQKINLIKAVCLILTGLVITSCATTGQNTTKSDKSDMMINATYIESKAQIFNKKDDSTNTVTLDIFLDRDRAIKIDISAILGVQLGSMLMNTNQIRYTVKLSKLFVQGPFASRTLRPLFSADIEPRYLWSVIHNQSLSKQGMKCYQREEQLEECIFAPAKGSNDLASTITIEKLNSELKKIVIDNKNLRMTWLYKSVQAIQLSQNETFVLNQPSDYKLLHIK